MFAVDRDFWHGRGYTLLYETTPPIGPHFDVIGSERLLGICPLMPLYRNMHATIPEWAQNQQAAAFPLGRSDRPNQKGSRTFIINRLALAFSR